MSAGPKERALLKSLLPLLLLVGGVHLALRWSLPVPALFGDEAHFYLKRARDDVESGQTSLLPGTLTFDHRLRFPSRIYARLRRSGDLEGTFRNIEALYITLGLLAVALVWMQARLLGLSPGTAALAGGIVGLFPWQAFHMHSLWPETLHTFLFALAFTGVLAHVRSGKLRWLFPAGAAFGFDLFAKATMQAFLPVVVVALVVAGLRRDAVPARRPAARAARAAGAVGLFLAGLALVIVPQSVRNVRDGFGPNLSANRWWNLELGLTPLPPISAERVQESLDAGMLEEGEVRWLPLMKSSLDYMAAAEHPTERERLARQRTLTHLRERGPLGVVRDQLPKFGHTVLLGESCFEQSIGFRQRWGTPTPVWLSGLRWPARVFWWVLLPVAALGVFRTRCRTLAWCLTTLLLAYIVTTVFLIPMKFRFFLPALPVLALFAAKALDRRTDRRDEPASIARI